MARVEVEMLTFLIAGSFSMVPGGPDLAVPEKKPSIGKRVASNRILELPMELCFAEIVVPESLLLPITSRGYPFETTVKKTMMAIICSHRSKTRFLDFGE